MTSNSASRSSHNTNPSQNLPGVAINQETTPQGVERFSAPENDPTDEDLITPGTSMARCGGETKNGSIHDSGYGSSGPSIAMTTVKTDGRRDDDRSLTKVGSFPLPGHPDLCYFKKPVDEATLIRFKEVISVLERQIYPLIESTPKPRSLAIREIFLGRDESDIAPSIVVLCQPGQYKIIRNVVSKDLVRDACESPGHPTINIFVTDSAPRPRLAQSHIEVCRNSDATFCGTPILLVNKFRGACFGETRKATVGGIVKITTGNGSSRLYGMTAGHTLDNWSDASTDKKGNDDIDVLNHDEKFPAQGHAEFGYPSLTRTVPESQAQILSESWDFADCESFGEVLDGRNSSDSQADNHPTTGYFSHSSRPNQMNCVL
jgi:hypothetical protein